MTTRDVEAAVALVKERWGKLLPIEGKNAALDSLGSPYFMRGLGVVAPLHLYEKATFQGPTAELIVAPIARLSEAAAALDELAEKLKALQARGLEAALKSPLAETLGLEPATYVEGMFAPNEETVRRREAALKVMDERFDAVAARMKEVYGLRLPRYLATFAAFWRSLDEVERKGMDCLGRSPNGIMVWFEDGGLNRKTRDGLDARLEGRFRADPPEMVTIGWGDSDGLHYGLWYDDPADPPTYIVHNYARDSAETWPDKEPTPIRVFAGLMHERITDPYNTDPVPLSMYAAREALAWFAEADKRALEADPPAERWLKADRIPTIGTFGPALPPGAGSIRVGTPEERLKAWRGQPARVSKWIASAKRDCAEGKPAAALTFGLDLHWVDDADEHRKEALELMVMAYEKLGRQAHAETVKVHYAHRDLGSVGVFLGPNDAEAP
jgi:hypothetical protein